MDTDFPSTLCAAFSAPEAEDRIVDLGTGCGIISLVLGCRYPAVSITGIEVQPDLFQFQWDFSIGI